MSLMDDFDSTFILSSQFSRIKQIKVSSNDVQFKFYIIIHNIKINKKFVQLFNNQGCIKGTWGEAKLFCVLRSII